MIKIQLKAHRDEAVKRFHPWIFSGAIHRMEGNPKDGDIVEVISVADDATGDNYTITHKNEYDEVEETFCTYEDMFKLYVFVDDDE